MLNSRAWIYIFERRQRDLHEYFHDQERGDKGLDEDNSNGNREKLRDVRDWEIRWREEG